MLGQHFVKETPLPAILSISFPTRHHLLLGAIDLIIRYTMGRSSGSSKLAVKLWIYTLGLSSDRLLIFEEEERRVRAGGRAIWHWFFSFLSKVSHLESRHIGFPLPHPFFLRPRNARETNRELEKIKTNQAPKKRKERKGKSFFLS